MQAQELEGDFAARLSVLPHLYLTKPLRGSYVDNYYLKHYAAVLFFHSAQEKGAALSWRHSLTFNRLVSKEQIDSS